MIELAIAQKGERVLPNSLVTQRLLAFGRIGQ
jgi:hypothetical protein